MPIHTFQGENPLTEADVMASIQDKLKDRNVTMDPAKLKECSAKYHQGCSTEQTHQIS